MKEYDNTPAKSKPSEAKVEHVRLLTGESSPIDHPTNAAKTPEVLPGRLRPGTIPYCPLPKSHRECDQRVKALQREMGKSISDYAYRMGVFLRWKKQRLPHGEFQRWYRENVYHSVRTGQNYMAFSIEIEMGGRKLDYNPRGKSATVAYLDSDAGVGEPAFKRTRPRHDSEPLNWNASEFAQHIFKMFVNGTARRTIEEMRDALAAFNEFAGEYIDERDMDRKTLRGEEEDEL